MIPLANRLNHIRPSASLEVAEQARRLVSLGEPVIDLSLGEPDFRTPQDVCEAASEMLRAGLIRYDSSAGTLELRKAIASKLRRENNLDYSPDSISVGCGAKQIISSALLATLNEGDEVVIPAPYWTSYPEMVRLAGGIPIIVHPIPEQRLRLTPASLAAAVSKKTKWLILNTPNNPSGVVYSADELAAFASVLEGKDYVGIISDEIYEHVVFAPHPFVSFVAVAPTLRDRTLTVNGVSKSYAMTGWRVGYGVGPKALMSGINTVMSQTTTHTSTLSQHAAAVALIGPQKVRESYSSAMASRAKLAAGLVSELPGCRVCAPEGAFYCYVDCEGLIGRRVSGTDWVLQTDIDIARYLLSEASVAVVPGTAYGLSPYFRLSFAIAEELLSRALMQIHEALRRLE